MGTLLLGACMPDPPSKEELQKQEQLSNQKAEQAKRNAEDLIEFLHSCDTKGGIVQYTTWRNGIQIKCADGANRQRSNN